MKQPSLEETIINKVESAKIATQEKYFKEFIKADNDLERNEIGAKVNALKSVTFDLIKAIRGNSD